MKRIYHHFSKWEERSAGLWRINPEIFDHAAAEMLMRDTIRWVDSMQKVTLEWPCSCEQNLSHVEHNRVAWLGQAAVCLAIGQPSVVTRQVWWQLTQAQQDAANAGAAAAIKAWEVEQCPDSQLELMF